VDELYRFKRLATTVDFRFAYASGCNPEPEVISVRAGSFASFLGRRDAHMLVRMEVFQ
jgi:hypothetical protein